MKLKIGLIGRILIAIALAVGLGLLVPNISEAFGKGFVRFFATFNMLFGGFLNFVVPLIIIGFIVPGIAKLGQGSGKLLGLATVFAYGSTIFAGIMAYFVARNLLPTFISERDRKSTRLNSSHVSISYAVFCLKKKNNRLTDCISV